MATKMQTQKSSRSTSELKDARIISYEEFTKHDKVGDCWIQIEDMIFDVSEFMHTHPGGLKVMLSLGGRDATFPFQMNHAKDIWTRYLSSLFVGYLEPKAVVDIYKEKRYSPVPELTMSGFKPAQYPKKSKKSDKSDENDSDSDASSESSEESSSDGSSSGNGAGGVRMGDRDALLLADYRKLWKRLDMEGYFITDYNYYYRKIIVYAFLFFCSLLTFHLANVTDSIMLGIAASAGLGMFWQQCAFIGHDLGHIAVTHNCKWDTLQGLFFGNFIAGISLGWWKYTHNVHHIRTNDVEFDPDIQHLPVFAITKKYLDNVYSMFHDRVMEYDGVAKVLVKHQHWLFIPICLLARVNLTLQSFIYIIWTTNKTPYTKFPLGKWQRVLEFLTLCGYFCWAYPVFYHSHHPMLYWLITHMVAGILHIQIVINHFPCPAFDDLHPNFFLHQIQSTIDIKSNRYTDWFHGGLQYQVEHHLFPNIPRHNLKKLKPMIQQLCTKHGIQYREKSFMDAVRATFNTLESVASASKEFHIHTF